MTYDEEQQRALDAEQRNISDAGRVKEFLADRAVSDALKRIEKRYLADFRVADTDEKRRNVWASTRALADLVGALEGVLDSGKLAQHVRNTRTAAEGRDAARTSRKQ